MSITLSQFGLFGAFETDENTSENESKPKLDPKFEAQYNVLIYAFGQFNQLNNSGKEYLPAEVLNKVRACIAKPDTPIDCEAIDALVDAYAAVEETAKAETGIKVDAQGVREILKDFRQRIAADLAAASETLDTMLETPSQMVERPVTQPPVNNNINMLHERDRY